MATKFFITSLTTALSLSPNNVISCGLTLCYRILSFLLSLHTLNLIIPVLPVLVFFRLYHTLWHTSPFRSHCSGLLPIFSGKKLSHSNLLFLWNLILKLLDMPPLPPTSGLFLSTARSILLWRLNWEAVSRIPTLTVLLPSLRQSRLSIPNTFIATLPCLVPSTITLFFALAQTPLTATPCHDFLFAISIIFFFWQDRLGGHRPFGFLIFSSRDILSSVGFAFSPFFINVQQGWQLAGGQRHMQ